MRLALKEALASLVRFPFRLVSALLGAVLVALAAAVCAVVACYLWLKTDRGQLFAGAQVSKYATRFLNGNFTIGRVLVSLPEGVHVRDVLVADDTGAPVLSFSRFDFDFAWKPLLDRRFLVEELSLHSPRLHVRQMPAGFNIATVFRLRDPGPRKPKDPKPFELPVDVELPALRIVDLRADVALANVDPRFSLLSTNRIDLTVNAHLRRNRSLSYGLVFVGEKSGGFDAEGAARFAEGFAGVTSASGDLRVASLSPAKLLKTKTDAILRAELSLFLHVDWKQGARFPVADLRALRFVTSAGNVTGRAGLDAAERFDVRIATDAVRLERLPWGLVRKGLAVRGDFGLLVEAKGTVRNPRVLALVSVCEFAVDSPLLPQRLRGRASCAKLDARADTSSARADLEGQLAGVPLHLRAAVRGNLLETKAYTALPLEATLEAGPLPLAVVGDVADVPTLAAMGGTVDAALRVNGTVASPRTHFNLWARRFDSGMWKDMSVFFTGETLPSGAHAQAVMSQKGKPVSTIALRVLPGPGALPGPLPGVPLSKEAVLASRIEVDADISHLALPVPALAGHGIEGFARVRYNGSSQSASLVSSLSATGPGNGGEQRLGVFNASIVSALGPAIENPAAWRNILVTGNVEANISSLAPVAAFVPAIERIDGTAALRLQVRGDLRTPLVGARLLLQNVNVQPYSGASFNDINVDIAATEKRIDLREVSVNYGGVIRAQGYVENLFPALEPEFGFQVNANDVRALPLQSGSPTIEADIRLSGALKAGVLNATTRIEKLRAYVPNLSGLRGKKAQSMKPHAEVIIVNEASALLDPFAAPPEPPPKEKDEPGLVREAHLTIEAPHNIWIQGPDVQAEIATRTKVNYANGTVTIDGETSLNRPGFAQFLGKRFNLTQARVVFEDIEPRRGEIEAQATFVADEATVYIDIDGPISKPELKLSADPEMSQFEIASLIVTGKTAEQLAEKQEANAGEANTQGKVTAAAANAVGGMVANQLLGMFAKNTDLVVSLDVEDAQERQAKVGVGRYVSDRLFVSFDKRFGAEQKDGNSNEVSFDYRLTRRWSVEGNYGDGHQGGVDLLWKKKF